jgi:hypothetical protein
MNQSDEKTVQNLPLVQPPQPGEKRAAGWQIVLTALAAITIIAVFLWGVTNQRSESGGEQTAATQPAPATSHTANPQGGAPAQGHNQNQTPEATTGAGGSEARDSGADANNKRPDQQAVTPAQHAQPTDSNGQPAQAHGK